MKHSRWIVVAAVLALAVAWAAPAQAEVTTADRAVEMSAAPYVPAPGTDRAWSAVRLDPSAGGFIATAGPCAAPCAAPCPPASCCPQECCPRDCWDFRIGLMGWLPGVNGNITLGGVDTDVDFGWNDWFDNLDKIDFVLQPTVSVRYKKWHFDLAAVFMTLGDSVPLTGPGGGVVDAELSLAIVKGAVGYELYRKSASDSGPFPCFTAIAYAGARWYSIGVDANLNVAGAARRSIDNTESWVDPIVGGRLLYEFHRSWGLFLDGDIGGFGVGSDFAWHLGGGLEWRTTKWLALQLGWSALDVDYDTGSGTEAFGFDVRMSGPFFNVVFTL